MQSEFFDRITRIYKLGFYDTYDIYRFVIYKKIKPTEFELITKENFATFQENLIKMHLQKSEKL